MSIESCYEIPDEMLKKYSSILSGAEPEKACLIVTLLQIGLSEKQVEGYLEGSRSEQLRLLSDLRGRILSEIHISEERLSRVDYLRFKVMEEKHSNI